ncbi:hypothetical protein J3E64_003737 [Sphingobium sp. OAS761]|uniref:hypothetical protein n=1 Tax=Sphingobium sp. OAS761 TaxID=2817901 RepID=UPI0020A0729E|nr:hypothetical protein [Sphingobium sp. OAS761]MCP1472022.1 hypothetical protein [Sphingobium sp. OAS761]
MTWTTIRLELDRTPAFPKGSAARSYVLRLPLKEDGTIDEQAYRAHAELATVRRFWPNEPDRHGAMRHTDRGWALSYMDGDQDDGRLFRLEDHAIRPGSYITLTEPDGVTLPFLVKGVATA